MPRSRREKGTGTVYYSEYDQKWISKLVIDGRPVKRKSDTEKEAKQKLRELIRNQESLANQGTGKYSVVPFDEYVSGWLDRDKKDSIAPASYRNLSYDLSHYVSPVIGTIPISRITSDDIQKVVREMTHAGRALSTQKRVKSAIKNCMDYAVERKDIPFNPCYSVKLPSKRAHPNLAKKPICVLTEEEVRRYVERATALWPNGTPIYRIGWGLVLILATGMRREEATALEWADVNQDNKIIRIRQVASFIEEERDGEKRTVQAIIPMAKSDSGNRYIPLSETATEAIAQLKDTTGGYRYVLGTDTQSPINMNTLSGMNQRIMKAAYIERHDGSKTGLHSLRHTFCSHLIMSEPPMDIKTISEIMGHKDTRITLDTYGHIFDERKQKAIVTADFIKKSKESTV